MKLFSSVSVKWKIYAIVIVSLVGFAAYLGFNVLVNTKNAQILADVRDTTFPILERAKANREKMDRIQELFNTAVTIAEMDFVDDADALSNELLESMDVAIKLASFDADELREIKADYEDFYAKIYPMSEGMIEGTIDFEKLGELVPEKDAAFSRVTEKQDAYIAKSLAAFKEGIRQANQNSETLLQSGFVLWLINVIILAATAFTIARVILTNIVNVSTSLEEIATGEGNLDQEIAVKSSDEIGQLAISFNHLLIKLREKTNDLMSMMQNMHQGLFTVMKKDDKFLIHPEYAAYIEKIFEVDQVAGREYHELLFEKAVMGSNELDQVITAVESIVQEDEMNFEFNSHLLPSEMNVKFPDRRATARGEEDEGRIKILELDWDPIIADDLVDKIMVTVRDVTSLRAAAKEAEAQKEELEIIGQILKISPDKFDSFLESAYGFLDKNETSIRQNNTKDLNAVAQLFANMHTIKGNARTYGFSYVTDVVHDAETTYDRLRKEDDYPWNADQLLDELKLVRKAIARYKDIKEDKLSSVVANGGDVNALTIEQASFDEMCRICSELEQTSIVGNEEILKLNKLVKGIGTRPLSFFVKGIVDSLPSIANQLSKAEPIVAIDDGSVGVKIEHSELLNNVFTHLLRNSIDHGLETREERQQKGKSVQGMIKLVVETGGASTCIRLFDDGKGLALSRIWEKAKSSPFYDESKIQTANDVAGLLFLSGISTAEQVSDISGRGVGMDAVKKMLQDVGANIDIRLLQETPIDAEFAPFELRVTLTNDMVEFY